MKMILDKLIEKKDISAYITARKRRLGKELWNITKFPEGKRQHIKHRLIGRIEELKLLHKFLVLNQLKAKSKEWWQ